MPPFIMKSTSLILPLLTAVFVSAHGYVKSVSVNGQSYPGNAPGAATNPSVIFGISTIDPVKGATNVDLTCGQNASPASNVADAMPGDTITIQWMGEANKVRFNL